MTFEQMYYVNEVVICFLGVFDIVARSSVSFQLGCLILKLFVKLRGDYRSSVRKVDQLLIFFFIGRIK